jgi:hypothetical protein
MDIKSCEPKKENRWVITFPEDFQLPPWVVKKTERPSWSSNGYHLIPKPIEIVFLDPIGPSTAQALWSVLIGLTDINTVTSDKKRELQMKFHKYVNGFDYTIEMLDPVGIVVEQWKITGCNITNINFGSLDYSSDDLAKCILTISFKKAELVF